MVAQLLGLRLQLLANGFRRSVWQLLGIVLATAVGVGLLVLAGSGLIALRSAPDDLARNLLVLAGSFVVLGFVLLPLVLGVDDDMDPRRFALVGFPRRRLSAALLLAALVSVPSLVIMILSALTVVTWSRGPFPVLLAVLSAVLAVATCVLAARVTTALASLLLATRRSRELTGVLGTLVLVLLAPAVILLLSVDWTRDGFGVLGDAAEVVSWTPFGAVWSVPGDAAMGDVGSAILKLVIAAATAALLWLAWDRLVAHMVLTPQREQVVKTYGGMGWFDVMPARPAAVVAARSITYWGRDPRYLVSIVIIPVVPLLMILPLLVIGVPVETLALIPLPVMALFLGWSLHNDLAFDSTAIWLHVVSGARGYADRIGRMFPVLLIGIPLVIVGSMISILFYGDWAALPSMLGVSSALFLGGVGLSSYISARLPYPAALPGDSPFQQPQASGTLAGFSQSLGLAGSLLIAAPALYFAWLGIVEDPSWHLAALWAGVGAGALAIIGGVWGGGRVFDHRGPEIMEFALSH
jgi:ABC-2 type transport system permease protein